ncbi:unnamed protein product [Closterium sp. Naga37s-1]|nr:unnamed protein product [Closterium sp. Naga37s-1]
MVRPKSPNWEHIKMVTADDGTVSCKCIHCGELVTANATRIGEHIFGTPNSKRKNVATCPSDYAKQRREVARETRSATTGGGGGSSGRGSTSTVELQPLRRTRQRDIREMADEAARSRLELLWATAVADNDLAFRVSSSRAMQEFVDAAIALAKPFTLPSPFRVGGVLLKKLVAEMEELNKPMKDSWATSGATLSVDGWTCLKSRGMVCAIAHNHTAPVIVECIDSKTAKKTGKYLRVLIQRAICKVGDRHVVQVVMDNAANNKKAAELLPVKRVLNQVHRVVMMVKGSASAVALFRTVFSKLELVRPGATRFGTQVIMMTRFLEVK